MGLVGQEGLVGLAGWVGLVGFIGLVGLVGLSTEKGEKGTMRVEGKGDECQGESGGASSKVSS